MHMKLYVPSGYIQAIHFLINKNVFQGFPGGSTVKNPPPSAGEWMGLFPDQGRFPHPMEQLILCVTTTEPVL